MQTHTHPHTQVQPHTSNMSSAELLKAHIISSTVLLGDIPVFFSTVLRDRGREKSRDILPGKWISFVLIRLIPAVSALKRVRVSEKQQLNLRKSRVTDSLENILVFNQMYICLHEHIWAELCYVWRFTSFPILDMNMASVRGSALSQHQAFQWAPQAEFKFERSQSQARRSDRQHCCL